GPELSYLFFWLAVVFAAWYGGLGPGLLATFLSALTADFSLFWPRFSWAMVRPTDLIGTALFAVLGAFLSFLVGKFQQPGREELVAERTAALQQANERLTREVADRQGAEQALRESEEKHRLLYESSRDAIMTLAPPTWTFTSATRRP